MNKVHKPLGDNKTDSAPYSYRGKILDRIKTGFCKSVECDRIVQSDCRHEKGHRQSVECKQRPELNVSAGIHGIPSGGKHEGGG